MQLTYFKINNFFCFLNRLNVNYLSGEFINNFFFTILIFLINLSSYADGPSGKIHLEGFGSWSLKIMNAGNGNLSITYDGIYSGFALNGTDFGNNASLQCVGGLTSSKGIFNDERSICKFLFVDGNNAFIK